MIRDVSNLLDDDGTRIPYKGWAELDLQIGDSEHTLSVPFFVTNKKVNFPWVVIMSYNT